jgi:hypothetical protein
MIVGQLSTFEGWVAGTVADYYILVAVRGRAILVAVVLIAEFVTAFVLACFHCCFV